MAANASPGSKDDRDWLDLGGKPAEAVEAAQLQEAAPGGRAPLEPEPGTDSPAPGRALRDRSRSFARDLTAALQASRAVVKGGAGRARAAMGEARRHGGELGARAGALGASARDRWRDRVAPGRRAAAVRAALGRAWSHPARLRFAAAIAAAPGHVRAAGGFMPRLRPLWRPRLLLMLLPALALLATAGYLAYCLATLPFGGGLVVEASPSALVVEAANGQVFATRGVFKGDKLAANELPPDLAKAVVAIEDRRFYEHLGLDLRGLARAAYRNFAAGGTREGGSTLTQQLVRMMYLSQDRTMKRKVQEAMLALWLEHHLSKDEILTRYLNTAYFGAGVYGADAAAKRYFGKTAAELSLSEAAMLAGLVRAPSSLAPHRNLDGARERADLVLDAMVETGAITRDQAEAARRQPASLKVPPETPPGTNYFVDFVNNEARRIMGSGPSDLTLRTTLDLNLQAIAESIVTRHLDQEGPAKKVTQGALIAMAPDGAILAMVGGVDYSDSQFNRATQAKRQPGSLFKLFVYLTALQQGMTEQSTVVDKPVRIGDWEPENYGGRFRGPVTLRTAFAHSINTVAAQLADRYGIDAVIATARKLGVTSDLPRVPSLALGSAEVTLLEMTRAFGAIAANAETLEPFALRSVSARDQTLYSRPQTAPPPAADRDARAEMTDLLTAVVREGTGKNARVAGPAAGKTGTTQDSRDAWFVGFTPDIIVGVWLGNDDNSPTADLTGGDLPAIIWREFVTQASRGRGKPAPQGPVAQAPAPQATVAQPPAAQASTAPQPPTPQVASAPKPTPEAPGGAVPAALDVGPKPPAAAPLRGVPRVVDTGTLQIRGQSLRLFGIDGVNGRAARELARYIRGREAACEPTAEAYRCRVNGQDLSEVILFNGGGRTTAEATSELVAAEEQARAAQVGVWER